MARSAKAERQQAALDIICRNAVIDECAKCIPTSWLDCMLSGPDAVTGLPARQTEELLRRIQDRIRGLKTDQ